MRCGLIGIATGALALMLPSPAPAREPASTDDLIELSAAALEDRLLAELGEVLEVRSDIPGLSGPGSAPRVILVSRPHPVVTPTVCAVNIVQPEYDPPLIDEGGSEGATPRRIVGLTGYSLYWVDATDPLGRQQADCLSRNMGSDHFFTADNDLAAALGFAALKSTIHDAADVAVDVACPLERTQSPAACRRILGTLDLRRLTSVAHCETAALDLMCVDLDVGEWALRLYGTFHGTRFGPAMVSLRRVQPSATP